MKIIINKDFSSEYKDEFWKGFSGSETLCIACAGAVAMGVIVGLHLKLGLAPDVAVYFGVPVALPILLLGFYKYQGNQRVMSFLRNVMETEKTRRLTMEMMAAPEQKSFCMSHGRKDTHRKHEHLKQTKRRTYGHST